MDAQPCHCGAYEVYAASEVAVVRGVTHRVDTPCDDEE